GRRRHLAGALLGHRLRGPSHRLRLLGAVRVAGNHQGYQAETRGSDDRPEPNERPHFIVPFLCAGKRRALTAAPDSAKKAKRCPAASAGRRACALRARRSPDPYEPVNAPPPLQKSTSARVANEGGPRRRSAATNNRSLVPSAASRFGARASCGARGGMAARSASASAIAIDGKERAVTSGGRPAPWPRANTRARGPACFTALEQRGHHEDGQSNSD